MAGERLNRAMSFTATGLTGTMEIHTKLQMKRRVQHAEHLTRQSDGSLMVTDVTLVQKASPIISFATKDLSTTVLGAADRQAVTSAVFSQPATGLSGGNTKITATFSDGVVIKGDIIGGDDPATEAEQAFLFISKIGEPTWAEAI